MPCTRSTPRRRSPASQPAKADRVHRPLREHIRRRPSGAGLERITAAGLAALVIWAVLTVWMRERWAAGIFQAGVFGLGALWALRTAVRGGAARGSRLLIPLTGIVLWGLLQLAAGSSEYRFATWQAVLGWGAALTAFLLALQALAAPSARHSFLRFLGIFGFLVSVWAVVQYYTSKGRIFWLIPGGYPEVLGPFLSRNTYSAFVELLLPVAVLESVRDRRRSLLWTLAAGAMFASVVAGASRAGTALVTAEVLLVALLAGRGRSGAPAKPLAALAKIAATAAVFTVVVGWQAIWYRFHEPNPYGLRRELLASTLEMTAARPWLGFGLGTWSTVYPAYARFDIGMYANHAHNDWAEWASEGGIPFALLLAAVAAWSARLAWRSPWGLGVPSVFLHGLVDFPLQHTALVGLLFTLLGALAAASQEGTRTAPAEANGPREGSDD